MIIGSDRVPYRVFLKTVNRWDRNARLFRVCRLVWRRGNGPGVGRGCTAKLSLAFTPKLLGLSRDRDGWACVLLGVRLHYRRSYGGWIT